MCACMHVFEEVCMCMNTHTWTWAYMDARLCLIVHRLQLGEHLVLQVC